MADKYPSTSGYPPIDGRTSSSKEGMIVTVTIKCKGRCYPSAGAIHLQRIANRAKMGSRVEPERFGGANPALGWGILEVVNPNPNRKHGSVGGLGRYKIGTEAHDPRRRKTDVDSYD
jgi:hypothetical protein